jgi:predicted lipoprotein with Yx(FWY)xxD motif
VVALTTLVLASCGSSSHKTAAASPAPGTMFSTANVAGLGDVLVDASGRTVYILTSSGQKNVPCDDASGCTKLWPDLPLPEGTTAATAGPGVQASMLGTMKLGDGETYPTYGGWLMYEYTGDTGPAQGHGQGIQSFGGTWYALNSSGSPITTSASPASTTTSKGYGY